MLPHISHPMSDLPPESASMTGNNGCDDVSSRIEQIAQTRLGSLASTIDQDGYYPLDVLEELAQAGLFSPLASRDNPDLVQAVRGVAAVSRWCGSTGFLVWCHMACALYLAAAPDASLNTDLLALHLKGARFGGTALSNPIKAQAGIEKMALHATRVAGGYLVDGTLPWVSHIAQGQYCGAVASLGEDRTEQVLFLLRLDKPELLFKCPHFSGMEGTSTWGIRLQAHFVPEQDVIASPAAPLLKQIKVPFLLLQCGMAAGIIQGAIDSMQEVEGPLGHVNQYLHDRPDTLASELKTLEERLIFLARNPAPQDKGYMLDVLDIRAHGAELALRATQSALLHQGARGYLSNAAPQRRVREAQFMAIVTPAIKHLRYEMDRLSLEEMPV